MEHKEDTQQDIDIAVLKNDVGRLKDDVTSIMTNHIPHLQKDVQEVKNRLAMWGGAIIILGILVPQFIGKIFN